MFLRKGNPGTSLVSSGLESALQRRGWRFDPGWGTKIPHASELLSLCVLQVLSTRAAARTQDSKTNK